jgi:flotillin
MHKLPPELVGIGAAAAVLLFLMLYRSLLRICRPNEILIFSGRKHTTSDGRTVGYRVVFGGRGVRIPVVERVNRMDVSLISVPIAVQGAYSEGGIPLNVHAIAATSATRSSASSTRIATRSRASRRRRSRATSAACSRR